MLRPVLVLSLAASMTGGAAIAQERPFTPALSCEAVRAIVARQGRVVLASSPTAYETVHAVSGACVNESTAAPAFQPTRDDPYCFAGYRCVQRNNGDNSVR